jgi:hypothetical protein
MENQKTYKGEIVQVWKPDKTLKISINATEKEIEELMFKLKNKVDVFVR